ncbi:MAG: hypothetical protein QXL76_00280 [Candidatus Rehaiarchaeum fermentans]|nr:hypothetical protein [Candidatus Rehaiarchaeum fermentans]
MKCDNCGKEIKVGRGIMYVRNDGTYLSVCSKKCLVKKLRAKS